MKAKEIRGPILSLLLTSLLAATASPASEIVHRLATGETLEDVAKEQWGEPDWAVLLRTHNDLSARSLREGQELRIPTSEERIAQKGDTWASLSRLTLGEAALGPVLAELNHLSADSPPPAGAKIRVPAIAIYRLQRGETLAAVARRFLSGTGNWKLLARLNQFGNPHRLKLGAEVKIPLPARPAADKAAPEESPATTTQPEPTAGPDTPPVSQDATPEVGAPGPKVPTPLFDEPLRQAVNAFLDGRYEKARDELETLRPEVESRGSPAERTTLLEYLTQVYVAFENVEAACQAYSALRAAEPEHQWNPDRISPKVIRLASLCKAR